MKVSAQKNSPTLGFTLIELLIVIAIIGILTAIAIPSFSSFNTNQRLSQAAKQVKNDLRSAQNRAINGVKDSNGYKVWGIWFADPDIHSYTVYTCSSLDVDVTPCTCTDKTRFAVKSLSDSFKFTPSTALFIFDQISGVVCDSGVSNSVTLDLDGSTRTITVSAGGKIEEAE